jgi:predicted transposase YdaD
MLGLTDIDLKQTRFYQNVLVQGRQERKAEGQLKATAPKPPGLPRRLERLRYVELPADIQANIAGTDMSQLEAWLERRLTAPTLAARSLGKGDSRAQQTH